MQKIISILILFFSVSAIKAQPANPFSWLTGKWGCTTSKGMIWEEWAIVNDSCLTGKSYIVTSKNDTIPQEKITLKLISGGWAYIPEVSGQNQNQPVVFRLLYQGNAEFIAENKDHDFPQRIAYRRIKNQLLASVEGKLKDKYRKQNFDYNLSER